MIHQAWTPEEDARLAQIAGQMLSASQAVAILAREFKRHFTRSSVIGRAHRKGIKFNGARGPFQAPAEVRAKRAEYRARAEVRAKETSRYRETKPKTTVPFIPPRIQAQPVQVEARCLTLMELEHGMCRWPLGEATERATFFCAADAMPDRSYCGEHFRMSISSAWLANSREGRRLEKELADV